MKTKEELNARKAEAENGRGKRLLTDEEAAQITAGNGNSQKCDGCEYNSNGACLSYRTMGTECPHGFA